jgi:thioredoxin-like negative regulator of GroEL
LQTALASAGKLPSLVQQIAKNGLSAVTNSELRASQLRSRADNSRSGMSACMREMGAAAGRYFTPEEKVALEKSLQQKNASMSRPDAYTFLLPLAEKAGLADLQANLMYERLLARGREYAPAQELESLQTRRLKLVEVGHQLEKIADVQVRGLPWSGQDYLRRAADIYHLAGSADDELRVLNTQRIGPQQQERYFELLLSKDPQRMVQYANQTKAFADAKANFVVANGELKLALAAVDSRGSSESQVWKNAYTGLVGLYFADNSPQIQNAFTTALGDGTIGQQLDKKIDRNQTLAGDIWFYYGSRYGEYLGITRKGDPEDFLTADVEHTPARAAAYFTTALYYEDAGDLSRAAADYLHVRELDPKRIDVSNRLAGIYSKQKRTEDAMREWKRALDALKSQAGSQNVPETFWGDYAATMNNLFTRKLLAQFQPDMQDILRAYVKSQGEYRLIQLLRGSHLEASAATSLALELSSGAEWRSRFLDQLLTAKPEMPLEPEPVYRALLDGAQSELQSREGASRELAQSELENYQIRWLQYLLKTKQYDRAREELAKLPPATPDIQTAALVLIQIKLAAQTGGLERVIDNFRSDIDHAPANDTLRRAAKDLDLAGDKQSARKLLEFVFTREIENRNLTAANMLGLAEIRIQAGDLQGGLALLRRLTLVVGNPFESQDPAAALLIRTGHPAEAISFLEELTKAQPWNADARVRLAQARIAAGQNAEAARKELAAVASSGAATYEVRLNAARSLQGGEAGADLGSRELNLIAGGKPIAPADANQPYFFSARLKAAESQPAAQKIGLLRAALEDNPTGDAARLPLLRAASEAGDFHLVVAAMKPVLTGRFESALERRRNLEEEDVASSEDSPAESMESDEPESGAKTLPMKDAAEITRLVGHAFNKTGDLDAALSYLRRAYRLETDAALKLQINREVQQVRAVQRRRTVNRARQPVISSRLEQEHVVHPRIAEPKPPAPRKGAGL